MSELRSPSPPRFRLHAMGAATLLLAAFLLGGCATSRSEAPAPRGRPPALVEVSRSAYGRLVETVTASGRIRALNRALVNTKITGRVERVAVREGDSVTAGQPLIWLDDRDVRAQVRQADAAVQAASARVQQLRTGVGLSHTQVDTDIHRAYQGVVQNLAQNQREQAELDDAKSDLRRKEGLFKQDAIPQTQLDTARLRYRQATANVRASGTLVVSARETLRMAHANVSQTAMQRDQLHAAQADLLQAEAARYAASVQLGYTVLAAPISGVVTSRNVEPGQTVTTTQQNTSSLLTIVDNAQLELIAPLNERYAPFLRRRASVEVQTSTDVTLPGRIQEVVPASDPTSHAVQVRVSIDSAGRRLIDGVYGTAHILVRAHSGVVVPLAAVQMRETETYVMAADGDRARKRPVQVDYQDAERAVLRTGLAAGVLVVSTGAENLEDGDPFTIKSPSAPSPSGAAAPSS